MKTSTWRKSFYWKQKNFRNLSLSFRIYRVNFNRCKALWKILNTRLRTSNVKVKTTKRSFKNLIRKKRWVNSRSLKNIIIDRKTFKSWFWSSSKRIRTSKKSNRMESCRSRKLHDYPCWLKTWKNSIIIRFKSSFF